LRTGRGAKPRSDNQQEPRRGPYDETPLITLLAIPLPGRLFRHADNEDAILGRLQTISTVAPTVPANGDVNPYSVTLVPQTNGRLHRGHVLVGNFNNQANLQGTGTTIVDVAPNGAVSLFAQVGRTNGYFWLPTAITRCQPHLLELCTRPLWCLRCR